MNSDATGMTIDELARRTRTTTRTLRLYQTKMLLPPPRIVGRVGYYTEMHVNRLLLIERLQTRGFSLAGIAELFKMWEEGKGLGDLFGLEAKLVQPWNEEQAEDYEPSDFEVKWPGLLTEAAVVDQIVAFGIIERLEDGRIRARSPMLLDFGAELVSKGVPIDVVMQQTVELREDTQRIAARFIEVFRTHMLPNMVHGGYSQWLPRLANYFSEMRPIVRNVLIATFAQAMDEQIDGITGRVRRPELEEEPITEVTEKRSSDPDDPAELKSAAGGH